MSVDREEMAEGVGGGQRQKKCSCKITSVALICLPTISPAPSGKPCAAVSTLLLCFSFSLALSLPSIARLHFLHSASLPISQWFYLHLILYLI